MDTVRVDRRELLRFMHSGDKGANGHHTALTGLMGEPLAIALLLHFLRGRFPEAQCVSTKVTTGRQKGPRLDAWISDGVGTLYQTEVKMWAGNAIGGLRLKEGLSAAELSERAQKQWRARLWDEKTGGFHTYCVRFPKTRESTGF